jgi:hypothetical protein
LSWQRRETGTKCWQILPTFRAKNYLPNISFLSKVRSSRLPEREAKVNMEEMWLLGKLTPDFYTIADFGAGRVFQARRIRERRRLQRRLDCLRSDVPHPPDVRIVEADESPA